MTRVSVKWLLILTAAVVFATGVASGTSPADYFPLSVGAHWKYIAWHDTTDEGPDRWIFADVLDTATLGIPEETVSYRFLWSENIFSSPDTAAYMEQYLTLTSEGDLAVSAFQELPGDSPELMDPLWIQMRNPLTPGDSTYYDAGTLEVSSKILSLSETIQTELGTFHDCLKMSQRITNDGELREETTLYFIPASYSPLAGGIGIQIGTAYEGSDTIRTYRFELVDCAGIVTDVQSYDIQSPLSYDLHQNFPNPFNPSTTIDFAVPRGGWVSLCIHNTLGQIVTVLADRYLGAGAYHVTWDGTDHAGNAVASGIYLYTLKTGNFVMTKKMILVK
jgi:hypothetical protein